MAEEAFEARGLVAALNAAADDDNGSAKPLTINDVPNDVLVSIFMAAQDLRWVRHTFPLVCKAWNELYCSEDASPLHEALEVDFKEEVKRAWEEWLHRVARPRTGPAAQQLAPYRPLVHASKVIEWAEKRASSVRVLDLKEGSDKDLEDFSSEDLGALVRVVGPSLTRISIDEGVGQLVATPFWDSLRDSVVPAGRLRSFVVDSIKPGAVEPGALESKVAPLGRLAGSLERLFFGTVGNPGKYRGRDRGLTRFPEAFCGLTELRKLSLIRHRRITALPSNVAQLKKLEVLILSLCSLSSLPKELGELSKLEMLDISCNDELGHRPHDNAFPAELGKMKSLRVLNLSCCSLRTVPAFVGELESLVVLDLAWNDLQFDAPPLFLIQRHPDLYLLRLMKGPHNVPWTGLSLLCIAQFRAVLRTLSTDVVVEF